MATINEFNRNLTSNTRTRTAAPRDPIDEKQSLTDRLIDDFSNFSDEILEDIENTNAPKALREAGTVISDKFSVVGRISDGYNIGSNAVDSLAYPGQPISDLQKRANIAAGLPHHNTPRPQPSDTAIAVSDFLRNAEVVIDEAIQSIPSLLSGAFFGIPSIFDGTYNENFYRDKNSSPLGTIDNSNSPLKDESPAGISPLSPVIISEPTTLIQVPIIFHPAASLGTIISVPDPTDPLSPRGYYHNGDPIYSLDQIIKNIIRNFSQAGVSDADSNNPSAPGPRGDFGNVNSGLEAVERGVHPGDYLEGLSGADVGMPSRNVSRDHATGESRDIGRNDPNESGSGGDADSRAQDRPLILDLSGNGIVIEEVGHGTQFVDANATGLQHRSAWAGAGNAVLFFDPDGRNAITEKRQYVFTEWDPTAADDLAAIRGAFDTNDDGVLSAADADFSKFKLMVTAADGSTSVMTLAAAGIASLSLDADTTEIVRKRCVEPVLASA